MFDSESYLTQESRVALRKFRIEYIAKFVGISETRVMNLLRGKARVLAIEKELIEELLGEEVAA